MRLKVSLSSPICVLISLSQRTSRILSAYVDDKAYSVELAGAVSSKCDSSYSFGLIVMS